MNDLPEQTTVWTPTRRASRGSAGTTNGQHPEHKPPEEEQDDALYTTRLPSSVRRYDTAPPTTAQTRTVIRVTRHQGPPPTQRASRQVQAPPLLQPQRSRAAHQQMPPCLTYVGAGMLLMGVLSAALSGFAQWWQGKQEDWQYGYPRTFQCDVNVKHGGVSHFTVENLNGHIIITEFQIGNLSKAKIYAGPTFSGAGKDLQPATVLFQDVNGDGYPDMILAVSTGRYVFLNDHTGFRPVTPADKINGEGK